jgi:hypothetical protein
MKVGIFLGDALIGEIEGSRRGDETFDGRLLWQRFPDDLTRLLAEYSSALEDISLHGWGEFCLSIQKLGLAARGENFSGQIEDLQVYGNGASLVRIQKKEPLEA